MEFSIANLQPKERASFALRALYEAAGCRKYHMGRFEEYGLYQENRSFLSSEQVITITDLDGRLLALKPDVTLSIAKTAQPAPGETLRYYYHENVYRPSAESHTFKEISQMGLEMLGAVGEAQVQQAVRLAAQSLAQLGAAWVLEVSHMGYLFGLFAALGVPENARPGLLEKLREKNAPALRRAATIGLAAALVLALGSVAYASDLGGIQRTVQLWLNGELTDATLTVKNGHYTVNYTDSEGNERERSGGGVAFEPDGTERALTEEELLADINCPEVTYRDDGTVTVYYLDQSLDITDRFDEDGVCYVQLEGGKKTIYMTIKRGNGYATSTTKYILPSEFNN